MTMAPHHFPELMVQLMASIPNGQILEYMDWFADLFIDPPRPAKGMMRPSERPGHGLTLNPDVVRDYRLAA